MVSGLFRSRCATPEQDEREQHRRRAYNGDATAVAREISDFLASAKDSISLSDVDITNRCAGPVDDAKYSRDYPSFTFIEIRSSSDEVLAKKRGIADSLG